MKKELHPVVVAVIIILVLAAAGYGIWWATSPRTPPGVKYTPGVPPWMEKKGSGPVIPGRPTGPGGPPVISPEGNLSGGK